VEVVFDKPRTHLLPKEVAEDRGVLPAIVVCPPFQQAHRWQTLFYGRFEFASPA
jgi:hypothetical protein